MSIALIGGMDRLERQYINEAKRIGIKLSVFTKYKTGMSSKVKNSDAVVIFTNKISHKAKKEVMSVAKSRDIPVMMSHSCGICTLRSCLGCLKTNKGGC